MFKYTKARRTCVNAMSKKYPTCDLLADNLWPNGEYRSFWKVPDHSVVECECRNIFGLDETLEMHNLVCRNDQDENKPPCPT